MDKILIVAHPTGGRIWAGLAMGELFEGIHYYVVEENVKNLLNVRGCCVEVGKGRNDCFV